MPSPLRSWRDVIIAASIGLTTEAVIWMLDFGAGLKLSGDVSDWIQIAQMPAAQIIVRLFSHGELAQALAFGILFQAALFSAIALSLIYICRLIRRGPDST